MRCGRYGGTILNPLDQEATQPDQHPLVACSAHGPDAARDSAQRQDGEEAQAENGFCDESRIYEIRV